MTQKDIIFTLLSISLLVVAWIAFGVFHNSVTSKVPEALLKQIQPIPANFDTATIDKVKSRNKVSPLFELTSSLVKAGADTSTASATPTPSVSSRSAQSTNSAQNSSTVP